MGCARSGTRWQTDYQQKLETFKPSYPAMVQLNNQIADIDRQLAAEVKTLKASYKAAYTSASVKKHEMKKRIESLKQDALDLQKRSIQYNFLNVRPIPTSSLYNGLLQRYKEVDIAGGVGANNVFVVDKATLPGGPSSPNMSQALFMACRLGLAAALGLPSFWNASTIRYGRPKRSNALSAMRRLASFPRLAWAAASKLNCPIHDRMFRKRTALCAPHSSYRPKKACRRPC